MPTALAPTGTKVETWTDRFSETSWLLRFAMQPRPLSGASWNRATGDVAWPTRRAPATGVISGRLEAERAATASAPRLATS